MYKIKNDELYYVFSRDNDCIVFKNYYKLLWWSKYRIERIGNNWNDTYPLFGINEYRPIGNCGYKPIKCLIEFIITDENYKIINVKQIKRDIENLKKKEINYHPSRINSKKWEFFRNSPVPNIFNYRGGPGERPPKIKSALIEYINYPEYNRSKRSKKYFFRYDFYRDRRDKCWKRNKINKQWQKGKK